MSYRHHSTFDIDDMPDDKVYAIRIYKQGRKVFPAGFKSFRIGYIQPAVNFPPMTAKYLYERFTENIKDQERIVIYDPSSGWGGRILGAMGVRDDRRIHYVGTDPNPDNFLDDGNGSKYESLADFYNTKTYRGNPFFSETNMICCLFAFVFTDMQILIYRLPRLRPSSTRKNRCWRPPKLDVR